MLWSTHYFNFAWINSLYLLFVFLFIYFWLCWGFVAVPAFLWWGESGVLSGCNAQVLIAGASLVVEDRLQGMPASVVGTHGLRSCSSWALEHRLSTCGAQALVALSHIESSETEDQTHISCIGRRIPYHWATREAPFTLCLNDYNYEDRSQNRIYVRFWKLWIVGDYHRFSLSLIRLACVYPCGDRAISMTS